MDSPVFNYISNLSPIQPVKAGPVVQGFPGLASPPLVFTSPRINSQTSFINRKLQSSSSGTKSSQDHDDCRKDERDSEFSVKLDSGLNYPLVNSDQKAGNTENLLQISHCSPSGCVDDFVIDPGQCAEESSHNLHSESAFPFLKGGGLEKKDNGDGKLVGQDASALQKGKTTAQSKSKISFKLIKNQARHLLPSSECSSRLLMDHTFENSQTADSINETSHSERGCLRRCLFEESQRKHPADGTDYLNPISNVQITDSVNESTEKSTKPTIASCVSTVAISKPLGIGLHLNSVVYPRSTDRVIGNQESSTVKAEKKSFVAKNLSDETVTDSNVIEKVPIRPKETDQHKACLFPTSDNTIDSDAIEQINDATEVKLDDSSNSSCDKRKLSSDGAENHGSSLAVLSSQKKRKKGSTSMDDDTDKRCNCRKTKCLKLYCDCFAAGFYCGESCACQGCFNRPEFKDTVIETRQQIESRNPLAFAPKIVQPITGFPAIVEELSTLSTPSSARHKRGCNCKKSMCLKKYCECYQANVGCSEGCRCEGCKNIYGIKEDYNIAREIMIKRASLEMSEGTTMANSNFPSSRMHNYPHLSPVTPALECSDQRKNAPKSRLPFRRFMQTLDSHHDMLTSEGRPSSPEISQCHGVLLEKTKSTDLVALHAEKVSENTVELVGTDDDPILAPCSQSSDTDVINSNSRNVSLPHSSAECVPPPPSSVLRWRSSPITPCRQSVTLDLKDFGAGSKDPDMFEDDTPEILKHSSTTVKSVKMSSPNKKRISPPHHLNNSSESLRSSRKFVLRAVPSFPSLTPYSKTGRDDTKGQP
ncbi:protein tesmin/TSO1-like CXC 2 isoform X2 [Amaranthus tricolor]|uniref:protein tesmin/TSO1-like CXC 2 isoform X2 n=1 Tax=Amaranthus tricolor TaxID=29722 RepID=UPI00258CA395|nr:protein tesmin/TSO1-like CXC 2 isoform X2 [Amaranthus tricolor]XP_057520644.1 protein tesmin/TSO1-like CXC 2 isoform X2 [Amaranthus tricolor]